MFSSQPTDSVREGIVYRKSQGVYTVQHQGQIVQCAISSKLRKHLIQWGGISQSTNIRREIKEVREIDQVDPVAIGDRVYFIEAPGSSGLIVEVAERRNKLSRLSSGPRPIEQVIVANVDQIIPVFAARNPAPKWALLDRYLAAAESAGIPSVIVITKSDQLRPQDHSLIDVIELYRRIGYRVLLTSTVTGEGLDEFAYVIESSASVMIGKSGVGKSSLLNAVQPGLGLRVNAVSEATGKGKHTTTHLEMFPLDSGGSIVDTPGMREFGLWADPDAGGLAHLFVEMRPSIGACRFGLDCTHDHEPGCAIKQAVEQGDIAEMRYHSYLRLLADDTAE
ncbi:MAG TPA: ribosome small subunit-dependent GTPase A [Aggregatilineaceae bacterium]|nr:ribosome small subunit-dependent GTPase A [Aggregatilineaceae bacterium]